MRLISTTGWSWLTSRVSSQKLTLSTSWTIYTFQVFGSKTTMRYSSKNGMACKEFRSYQTTQLPIQALSLLRVRTVIASHWSAKRLWKKKRSNATTLSTFRKTSSSWKYTVRWAALLASCMGKYGATALIRSKFTAFLSWNQLFATLSATIRTVATMVILSLPVVFLSQSRLKTIRTSSMIDGMAASMTMAAGCIMSLQRMRS